MAPLAERGLIRPVPMLVVTAIVNGPAHAVARRWLAGQVREPLTSYTDVLARAACAALSADETPGTDAAPGTDGTPPADAGRITVELLDADGLVTGRGEATIRLAAT
jgi:hypothetical protein